MTKVKVDPESLNQYLLVLDAITHYKETKIKEKMALRGGSNILPLIEDYNEIIKSLTDAHVNLLNNLRSVGQVQIDKTLGTLRAFEHVLEKNTLELSELNSEVIALIHKSDLVQDKIANLETSREFDKGILRNMERVTEKYNGEFRRDIKTLTEEMKNINDLVYLDSGSTFPDIKIEDKPVKKSKKTKSG